VTLRARWVTLTARWVTRRARWVPYADPWATNVCNAHDAVWLWHGAGFRVSGTYSFLPHGVDFLQPVQINCEYDIRAAVEAGGELQFYRSESSMEGPWEPMQGGTFQEGIGSLLVERFSLYYVGASSLAPPPPVQLSPPPIDPCFGLVPPEDDVVSGTEYILIAVLAIENLLGAHPMPAHRRPYTRLCSTAPSIKTAELPLSHLPLPSLPLSLCLTTLAIPLTGIGGIIMYISWRSRQRPKIIHVDDNLEPMLTLPGLGGGGYGYGDQMTLPGPYGGGELAPGLPLLDDDLDKPPP
jgi:hypothetical protein